MNGPFWFDLIKASWCLLKVKRYKQKYQEVDEEHRSDNNSHDSRENSRLLKQTRLIVGGLTLPTIAVCIDRLIYTMVGSTGSSSIVRTSCVCYRMLCFFLLVKSIVIFISFVLDWFSICWYKRNCQDGLQAKEILGRGEQINTRLHQINVAMNEII